MEGGSRGIEIEVDVEVEVEVAPRGSKRKSSSGIDRNPARGGPRPAMTPDLDSHSDSDSDLDLDLRVRLGRLSLPNPILVASGTFGYAREAAPFVRLDRLGGIVPKTITARPRAGNRTPRTVETRAGMLNAIGLDNDGLDYFLENHLPRLRGAGCPILVNIAGETPDQFVEMAARLDGVEGPSGLELNISCPNVSHGLDLGIDPAAVRDVVSRTRAATRLPIVAKLTPNVTDIVAIARAARDGGADAVSLVNTVKGMAIDWRRRRPILANDIGGLSGPAIKPIALRMVWEVARALPDLPIVGIGGVADVDDAMEFLVAGASAVQVGTATFYDPGAAGRLVEELPAALAELGARSVREVVGTLRSNARGNPAACAPGPGSGPGPKSDSEADRAPLAADGSHA